MGNGRFVYMKILVTDDELLIAKGIQYMIQKMGDQFSVDVANSADEAIQLMKQQEYDLLLTDICMPQKDGLQLIEFCRSNHLCKNFCVISGYAEFEYARQAIQLGVKDYLLKPIDKEVLKKLLERFEILLDLPKASEEINPYVQAMLEIIEQKYRENLSLHEVADQIGLNTDYAGKLFKAYAQISFSEYLNKYRIQKILEIIKKNPRLNFESIGVENGFTDTRSFYRIFKRIVQMTPGEYREKYLNQENDAE